MSQQVFKREDRYQLRTYKKAPIALVSGKGSWVTDTEGRKYLDLYGGHAVALTGHCHPAVTAAIAKQAKQLLFYSNVVYSPARAEACEALVKLAPKGLTQVFLCNSGTEANETALKIARRYTGRSRVISFEGSFHGRTLGALSATAMPHYRAHVHPLVEGHTYVPFGVVPELSGDVAAVIIEPVQSMAGCRVASPEFYRELRKRCTENGTILIFDEVQTGFGRTGKMFAGANWAVTPDLITFAKGAGSGVPVGGVLVSEPIAAKVQIGEQGTTFGGGPLACAAITATIGVIRKEKLDANAKKVGARLRKGLEKLPQVQAVSGLGLLLAAKLDRPAAGVLEALRDAGVLAGGAEDKNTLRLLPPLTLKEREADLFLARLAEILRRPA